MLYNKKHIYATRSLIDSGGGGDEEFNCVTLNSITAITALPSPSTITVEYRQCSDGQLQTVVFNYGDPVTQSINQCIVEGSLTSTSPSRTSYSLNSTSCGTWDGVVDVVVLEVMYGALNFPAKCTMGGDELTVAAHLSEDETEALYFEMIDPYTDFSEATGYVPTTNDYFYFPLLNKWYRLNPDGTIITSGTCA